MVSSYLEMKKPDAKVMNPVVSRRHKGSRTGSPTDLSVCVLPPPPHPAPGQRWICVTFLHVCWTKGLHSIKRFKCLKTSVTPVARLCFCCVQRSLKEIETVLFQVKAARAVHGTGLNGL